MQVITTVSDMAERARELRASGKTIGLVPTMGYLHDGHLSLVRLARKENDVVMLSIFVNPAQFGPGEDLDRYPRDFDGDVQKCRYEDVSIVFAPEPSDMYPEGFCTNVSVDKLSDLLCGASRPGHFKGVATVVAKLFGIVRPHRAYFGRKDYQQTIVIKRMASDLNMDVEVLAGQTVREPDGLAMSSRNAYLVGNERMAAAKVYRALASARGLREAGETRTDILISKVREVLKEEALIKVEYISLVDPDDLHALKDVSGKAVMAVAVRIGKTRLIDNMLI